MHINFAQSACVVHINTSRFVLLKIQHLKHSEKVHLIDLEKIIHNKNPKLLKILPKFILNYIKKVIHQEDFNRLLLQTKDSYGLDFVKEALEHFQIEVISDGTENIPKNGGCIVVCNHPLGGIDGIAVMSEVGKIRPDLKAMVNDLLMNLQNLSHLMIPVNKHAKNAIQNLRDIDEVYASGNCVIIFPAGLVSRKQNGHVSDLEWKKGFISKAIKYKMSVVPVYIEAKNSSFFYNLALLRKKIGVKTNIEMFFLVDEVYKQKGKTIKMKVGKAIDYTTFTKAHSQYEWAQKVKDHVYELSNASKNELFDF